MLHLNLQDEARRLEALRGLDILDIDAAQSFDCVARIAKQLLEVPVAKINLVDEARVWPLAVAGAQRVAIPRELSFCTEAITSDLPLVVTDAAQDERFASRLRARPDSPFFRFYAGVPLKDRTGCRIGALCCLDLQPRFPLRSQIAALEDLGRLVMETIELRWIARSDGLTGALARGAFIESANRDIALSQRHGRALSCILMDIDHFKVVNDTYGHAAGDDVLRRLSAICAKELRHSDYIGRLGGEEFAILLRETDAVSAHVAAERLREAVSREQWMVGDRACQVTASFGVAQLSAAASTVERLLARADTALYAAKKGGRNRTMIDGFTAGFDTARLAEPEAARAA